MRGFQRLARFLDIFLRAAERNHNAHGAFEQFLDFSPRRATEYRQVRNEGHESRASTASDLRRDRHPIRFTTGADHGAKLIFGNVGLDLRHFYNLMAMNVVIECGPLLFFREITIAAFTGVRQHGDYPRHLFGRRQRATLAGMSWLSPGFPFALRTLR